MPAVHRNGHEKAVALREVALMGYADDTRDLINGMPDTVEVWGINAAHVYLKRKAHYWFQIHPKSWSTGGQPPTGYYGRPREHLDWLQAFDGAVWVLEPAPDIPNAKLYPLREIVAEFGREYLTSTFAYQLALALYEHIHGQTISTLHMFGINLSALEEYAGQRPCAEYWIGRLEQAGVHVNVPDASSLLKGAMYPKRGDALGEHALERHQGLKEKYMTSWANAMVALAMQTELKHWAKFLGGVGKEHPEQFNEAIRNLIQTRIDNRFAKLDAMANQFASDMNGALGMVKNNQHWLGLLGQPDFKAPAMPDLRFPSERLIDDFDLPQARTI